MKYTVEIYPSGSTVITDGQVALYVHTCRELVEKGEPLTDAERHKVAYEIADALNYELADSLNGVIETIGERLKTLRKRNGKKLIDISNETGLSVSYLSDIERGRTNPSLETCTKLATVYEITLARMFQGVG